MPNTWPLFFRERFKKTVKKHYWFIIALLIIKLLMLSNKTIAGYFFYPAAAGNEMVKTVYLLQISSAIAGFFISYKIFYNRLVFGFTQYFYDIFTVGKT